MENKGFLSRFKLRPFLEKKDSGRPFLRSELASVGISNSSELSESYTTLQKRRPTLPSHSPDPFHLFMCARILIVDLYTRQSKSVTDCPSRSYIQ